MTTCKPRPVTASEPTPSSYTLRTMRGAGLSARWGKVAKGNAAIIYVRDRKSPYPYQRIWWPVTRAMWAVMQQEGVRPGFASFTFNAIEIPSNL